MQKQFGFLEIKQRIDHCKYANTNWIMNYESHMYSVFQLMADVMSRVTQTLPA